MSEAKIELRMTHTCSHTNDLSTNKEVIYARITIDTFSYARTHRKSYYTLQLHCKHMHRTVHLGCTVRLITATRARQKLTRAFFSFTLFERAAL